MEAMIKKSEDVAQRFETQATTQRLAQELRPKEGARTALGALGETALGSVMGPVGGALGALHGIYGFAKNVPAAVATLVTLERVAQQVSRAVSAGASTLARGGVKASRVVRGEAAAGVAHHFTDDYKTARRKYDSRVAEVRALANNPEQMHATLTQQTEGWQPHAPKVAQAFQATTMRAVAHLAKSAYAPSGLGPLAPAYQPSRTEIAEYARRVEAVENPIGLLKQASAGTLTPEAVQTVREVHPQLYAKMVGEVMAKVADVGVDRLTYHTRLMLSMFTGQDLDGSTLPAAMQANQATFVLPQPEQNPPGMGPGKKDSSKITLADRAMTPMQRIEKGEKS
jgi:hypothetical protein